MRRKGTGFLMTYATGNGDGNFWLRGDFLSLGEGGKNTGGTPAERRRRGGGLFPGGAVVRGEGGL